MQDKEEVLSVTQATLNKLPTDLPGNCMRRVGLIFHKWVDSKISLSKTSDLIGELYRLGFSMESLLEMYTYANVEDAISVTIDSLLELTIPYIGLQNETYVARPVMVITSITPQQESHIMVGFIDAHSKVRIISDPLINPQNGYNTLDDYDKVFNHQLTNAYLIFNNKVDEQKATIRSSIK